MVVFDTTALSLLFHPSPGVPKDPATGEAVVDFKKRMDFLVSTLAADKETILVPTPALSEFLIRVEDAAADLLPNINKSAHFKIADFDQRAAIEAAAMTREAIRKGDKKEGSKQPWQKIKIDRQIVAVARVHGATVIYSDDQEIKNFAALMGLSTYSIANLPLPPEDPQHELFEEAAT